MRISAKGRYALAAMVEIAAQQGVDGGIVPVISIAGKLGISKIYLEQVLSILKRDGFIDSAKGSRGGYSMARKAGDINAYEVLAAVERALIEQAEPTVEQSAPDIERALRDMVYTPLDTTIKSTLTGVTVEQLLEYARKQRAEQAYMINM